MSILLAASLILLPPLTEVDRIQSLKTLSRQRVETPHVHQHGMGTGGLGRWSGLVAAHFAPEDRDRVLCLMGHESGGNPTAVNPSSGASGLMQVMPFWADHYGYARSALFDPAVNLRVARLIRDSQGWTAWAPYNRGLCR
jgi:soluble lytic murein transglycosylase-like protein